MYQFFIEIDDFLLEFNFMSFRHNLHINYILFQFNFQNQNLVAYFTLFHVLFGHVFDNYERR